MTPKPRLSDDGRTVTVRVPISIRRRGGRRLVLAPGGTDVTAAPASRHIDNAMVKAVIELLGRRPTKVVAVALANKMARIAWAVLAKGEPYRVPTRSSNPVVSAAT